MITREKKDLNNKKKIAVIHGGEICSGALGAFSEDISAAFNELGHESVLCRFDDAQLVTDVLSDPSFDAIVGFQNGWFTRKVGDRYLSELSDVPKFDVLFDTPSFIRCVLKHNARNITYLYQDEQYAEYVSRFYDGTKVYHYPIGGSMGKLANTSFDDSLHRLDISFYHEKKYDLSFIGAYNDYRKILQGLSSENEDVQNFALDYFDILMANPYDNAQKCYMQLLRSRGIENPDESMLELLEHIYHVEQAVFSYYREKVIKEFLDNEIEIHVFSDSWRLSPYSDNTFLHIHEGLPYRKALDIMAQSRLTLNVFSWHKGGMTERISNSLINGAVCVTDSSSYLDRNFQSDQMLIFDLLKSGEAAAKIRELLNDDEERIRIAENGFKIGYENYRWINCAQRLLDML